MSFTRTERNLKKMRDSFVFYRSFFEGVKELDPEAQLKVYNAIFELALNDEQADLSGASKAVFLLIKPQIEANNKRYSDGKKGGRPKNQKTSGYEIEKPLVIENEKTKKPNVNVNVNVNENVNENVEVVEAPATSKNDFTDLSQWLGEYSNVHLTDRQYADLVQYIGAKKKADELIEELSSNIASKKENAPPYDENFPDMHLAKLKAYWKFQKLRGDKAQNKTLIDKQNEYRAQLKALADKFRAKEEVNSG